MPRNSNSDRNNTISTYQKSDISEYTVSDRLKCVIAIAIPSHCVMGLITYSYDSTSKRRIQFCSALAVKPRIWRTVITTEIKKRSNSRSGGSAQWKEQRRRIRISIYQKSCIVEYIVSDRLKFLFSVPCFFYCAESFILCFLFPIPFIVRSPLKWAWNTINGVGKPMENPTNVILMPSRLAGKVLWKYWLSRGHVCIYTYNMHLPTYNINICVFLKLKHNRHR